VLLTNITYVYYGSAQPAYLSYVEDASTKEIVAHHLSRNLKMDIVYDTLKKLSDTLNGYGIPRSNSSLRPRLPLHVPGVSKASEVKNETNPVNVP
jgi:hypothetical protein